jgi:DNA-binding beta-propeller fold protein YncE
VTLFLLLALGLAAVLIVGLHSPASPDAEFQNENGFTHRNASDHTPMTWQCLGSQGDGAGQFQQPRGIASLPDGTFVVVDRAARVQHFSADGKVLKFWSMTDHALGNPKGLCALPNGNLLVCDTHYGRLLEMSLSGDVIKHWGGPGTGPGQFTHPLSACVNAKLGRAYIVEYHAYNDRVQVFDLDGKFIKAFGSCGSDAGQFSRPSGITLDADGNVYVADSCNHRIQKFDAEGKLLKLFGKMGTAEGELRYPYDIAFGYEPSEKSELQKRAAVLYVAEYNNMRVSVFDTEGRFIRFIGQPGAGKGQFASPWSLSVDAKGRLLVSDTGNHRVQIFDFTQK